MQKAFSRCKEKSLKMCKQSHYLSKTDYQFINFVTLIFLLVLGITYYYENAVFYKLRI